MSLRTACAAAVVLSVAFGAGAVFAAEPADPVVAVVNGAEIRRSDVTALQQSMPQLKQIPLEMVFDQIVEHLINSRLIVSEARKAKLAEDPQVKEKLRQVEDQILQQAFLMRKIEGQLTDEALKQRYEQLVKNAPPKEEVHARHILLSSEDEAKKAIAEIEGGKSFEDVAKSRSTGPSGDSGGDLGYFSREDMVPEFAAAAFALNKGELTKTPVKTQFGWHVIKVEDKRTAAPPSFDEVKDELREQMGDELVSKVVGELRAQADVKIFKPEPAAAPAVPGPAAPGAQKPADDVHKPKQ